MGVGERIKKILKERDITIKDLSLLSGVSLNTLYGITKRDNETVKNEIIIPISDVLKVPTQYLLGINNHYSEWSKEEMNEFDYNSFIDTEDGLLSQIIQICTDITTEGRLKCLEYLNSIENDYLTPETIRINKLHNELDKYKLIVLNEWYENKKISDTNYQKLKLIFSKNVGIPYPRDHDEKSEIYINDEILHNLMFNIRSETIDKISNKTFIVSKELSDYVNEFYMRNSHSDDE
mgnify:CR=1 FL=1